MKSEKKKSTSHCNKWGRKAMAFQMPLKVGVPPPIRSRHVETCQRETHSQVNPGFLEALA